MRLKWGRTAEVKHMRKYTQLTTTFQLLFFFCLFLHQLSLPTKGLSSDPRYHREWTFQSNAGAWWRLPIYKGLGGGHRSPNTGLHQRPSQPWLEEAELKDGPPPFSWNGAKSGWGWGVKGFTSSGMLVWASPPIPYYLQGGKRRPPCPESCLHPVHQWYLLTADFVAICLLPRQRDLVTQPCPDPIHPTNKLCDFGQVTQTLHFLTGTFKLHILDPTEEKMRPWEETCLAQGSTACHGWACMIPQHNAPSPVLIPASENDSIQMNTCIISRPGMGTGSYHRRAMEEGAAWRSSTNLIYWRTWGSITKCGQTPEKDANSFGLWNQTACLRNCSYLPTQRNLGKFFFFLTGASASSSVKWE